jgi:CheY-like chemotaxis protein
VPATPSSNPEDPEPTSLGFRVLVVDDTEANRRVATIHVERLGAVPVSVPSGTEALDRLAAEPFDLVLLDSMMPGLDGPAVAREVRRREAASGLPAIPIVALTASVLPEDRARMLDAGMDDHLGKPLQPDALGAVLARQLPPGTAQRTSVIPAPPMEGG